MSEPCVHEINRRPECEACGAEPRWQVFAAYDYDRYDPAEGERAHPLVARYPAPQRLVCSDHLAAALDHDAAAPGSTMQWAVKPI